MEKRKLYFAASLFNLADRYFNSSLVEKLSENFNVILPQRLGFEFSKLDEALEDIADEWERENITNQLIYYLELGFLLPQADFCVARLDEPIDEGVVSEIGHSRKVRIPVIGYRTDSRSPYGSNQNEVLGCHFFPAYDCDMFINFLTGKVEDVYEGRTEISKLAGLIFQGTRKILKNYSGNLPHKDVNTNSGIHYIGNALFSGIEDLHSEDGLKEIVRRYQSMRKAFGNMISTEIIKA